MSRTIKAIERHMTLPVRSTEGRTRRGELGLQSRSSNLVAEWQQHGPETFSGHALRKLRLALAPAQPVINANAAA
jgi:hypothetical protein